ncbi:MAG TPA: ATP-binding protein [Solirubrobacteraceae bacterium]|nr:ATP-binding protein [Solirubrobacteraceae bacterium]
MLHGARARHVATTAIALSALTPIVVVAAYAGDGRLGDPLLPVLAAGAAVSNVVDVRFAGRLWLSGSFLCCLMAVAVLGPSAGVAVALASELAAWAWSRFSFAQVVVNGLGAVAPTWIAGLVLLALRPVVGAAGLGFDLALGLVTCIAVVTNVLIVSSLMSLHEGTQLDGLVAAYRRFLPFLAANVVLLVAITETYHDVGIAAAISLIVVVLVFTYVVRLAVDARERADQVEALSADRGRLVAEAVGAEQEARRALAEHLHDGPLQALLSARQDIEEALAGDVKGLNRADQAVRSTVAVLRDAVFELHPSVLEHAGLGPALVAVAEAKGKQAGFVAHVSVDRAASGVNDQLLFSLARELIGNAAKHASARNVSVQLARCGDYIELVVRDDGQGFEPNKPRDAIRSGHIGLASIGERATAAGGDVKVNAQPGTGTTVTIRLPVRPRYRATGGSRGPVIPASRGA